MCGLQILQNQERSHYCSVQTNHAYFQLKYETHESLLKICEERSSRASNLSESTLSRPARGLCERDISINPLEFATKAVLSH